MALLARSHVMLPLAAPDLLTKYSIHFEFELKRAVASPCLALGEGGPLETSSVK
jgi:hypothetical protein